MKYTNYILINILLPLLIGFIIYILFRGNNLLIYSWTENLIGFDYFLPTSLNLTQSSIAFHVPEWIKFSLSDALWIYVFTSSVFAIWAQRINIFWLFIPLLLGIGLEVFQGYKVIPGIFDTIDILFLITGYVLAVISGLKWRIKCIEQ